MEVGWSTPRPSPLSPGRTPVPIVWWLVWPQVRSGQVRKISLPPDFDPRTVQPVASILSVYASPAHVDRSVDTVKNTELVFDIAAFPVNMVEVTLVKQEGDIVVDPGM